MPVLTPTRKAFLEEVLKVKPKKKGLLTRGPGDNNVQATAAFKEFRKSEEATIAKIAKLGDFTDTAGVKNGFETRVKTIQDEVARTNKNDPVAAKNTFTTKSNALLAIGIEVDTAIQKAGLRAAHRKELTTAEGLLGTLTSKNTPEMTFDVPLKNVVDLAKTRQGDETPDAANQLKIEAKRIYDAQTVKVGQYATCVTALEAAEGYQTKLKALNRTGFVYDPPLGTIVDEAKRNLLAAKANSAKDDEIAAANVVLAKAGAKYNEQVKKSTKDQQGALDTARHKPVYEDKLARVHEAIQELTPLHGAKAALDKLNALIEKAKPFADQGQYEKAFAALAGLTGALKEGRKAAEDFHATAGGTACAKPLAKAETALKTFQEVAGLAQLKVVADAEAKVKQILETLDQPNPHRTVVEDMVAQANTLALDLKNKADEQVRLRTAANSAYETANTMFGELKMRAPVAVWEPRREELRAASALMGIQQYETARTDFETLTGKMTGDHTTATAKFQTYERLVGEYQTNKPTLDEAIGVPNNAVSSVAGSVDTLFRTLPAEMMRTHDYALGATEAQAALDKLPAVRKNLADYRRMADGMREAGGAVDVKAGEVRTAFKSHADCDLTDFQAQLDQLLTAWKQEVNTLFSSGKKVAEFKDQTITALAKIITDLDTELKKPGETDRRVQQAGTKKLQADFNVAKTQAARAIQILSEDDPAKAKIRQGEFDTIVQRGAGPAGLQAADLVALTKVKTDADKDAKEFTDQLTPIQEEAARLAERLLTDIKALEKTNKDYKDYFTDLRDRISDCRGLYESSVLAVAKKGKLQLEQLAPEVTAVKNNNAKGSTSDKSFAKVEEKIKALKKKIEKSDLLKNCTPSKLAVLKARADKDVPEETKKVSPEKAIDEVLHKFETDIDAAIAKAQEAQDKRTEITQKAGELRTELNQLADVPKLKASFTKRIEAAASPGEGGEDKAKLDLQVIEQLITAALDDPESRVAMERKANEDEFQAREAEMQWTAKSDVFTKNAKRKADAAYQDTPVKDRNEGLYNEIGETYKAAEKLAGKGAYVVAVQKLDQAIATAMQFAANPLGGAATARNDLRKVNSEWQSAVAAYVADLTAMGKTMDDENKADPKADLTKVKAELTRLSKLFDAQIFAPFIGTLTNDAAALPARRTAKEQALRFMREYRKTVKGDKVLAYLSNKNPFLPSFSTNLLDAKLNQLELNLLRE